MGIDDPHDGPQPEEFPRSLPHPRISGANLIGSQAQSTKTVKTRSLAYIVATNNMHTVKANIRKQFPETLDHEKKNILHS